MWSTGLKFVFVYDFTSGLFPVGTFSTGKQWLLRSFNNEGFFSCKSGSKFEVKIRWCNCHNEYLQKQILFPNEKENISVE